MDCADGRKLAKREAALVKIGKNERLDALKK